MSYTFKMETKSIHSIDGKEPVGIEIEVDYYAYWSIRSEEMDLELECIVDCDNGGELYPNEEGKFKLSEEDFAAIDAEISRRSENNMSEIMADSCGSDIDHAMDLMEDR